MNSTSEKPRSIWIPLSQPVFRLLWIASAVSTLGTWIHDTSAAWLMTSLSNSAILISLMQAAASLPFFLLALPAGALADIIDRRRMLLFTQAWMMLSAILLAILTLAGITTPITLLILTFALNFGSAMNMPIWQAIVPELVTKEDLPSAVTLNGIVINLSRSLGPALAGVIMAAFGIGASFLLNGLSFLGVILAVYSWKRNVKTSALPAERFLGSMQAGIRYARYSKMMQRVFIRTGFYIFFSSSVFALLPIIARKQLNLDSLEYGIFLGFWGIGGLIGGLLILPKLKRVYSVDRIVAIGSLLFLLAILILADVQNKYISYLAIVLVGSANSLIMITLSVSAQMSVPSWVRARALAIHLLLFQGFLTLGSVVWGAIAQNSGVSTALYIAAAGLFLGIFITRPYRLKFVERLDLTASLHWDEPLHAFEPSHSDGPVLITIKYRIDPDQAEAFIQAMEALSRSRKRDGTIRWGLFQDVSDPSLFTETCLVESWAEHQRQFERVTESDRILEERARSFHIGEEPPKISQMIYAKDHQ